MTSKGREAPRNAIVARLGMALAATFVLALLANIAAQFVARGADAP